MQDEVSAYKKKFMVSLILNIPIFLLMWVVPYTRPDLVTENVVYNGVTLYIFVLLGFSSAIQFYSGASFYKGAFKSICNLSANMDVLVVLGTTSAWLYGVILIIIGNDTEQLSESEHEHALHAIIHEHGHNFEVSSTLITVILLGKFLESYSKK